MYKNEFYILNILIICFSFFISLVSTSTTYLTGLKYLKTFELENGNILICSEKGIFLSEPGLENIISAYPFEQEITKTDLNFLTIAQYSENDHYIVIAYKTKIYIFNSEGNYVAQTSIDFSPGGTYYTLALYKLDSNINEYDFIIGYINGNNILISSYIFDKNSSQIKVNVQKSLEPNERITSNDYGYSCQIMQNNNNNNNEKVLTCFYKNSDDILISSYNLQNFSIINELSYKIIDAKARFILSVISNDKSKALVCYLKDYEHIKCDKYDINDNNINTVYPTNNENIKCKNSDFLVNMMYSSLHHNNIFYACLGYNSNYNIIKFNDNFEFISGIINTQYTIDYCTCASFDIIGSQNSSEYHLISSCEAKNFIVYDEIPTTNNEEKKIQLNSGGFEIINILNNLNLSQFKTNSEDNTYNNIDSTINSKTNTNLIEAKSDIDSTVLNNNLNNNDCSEKFLYQNVNTKECLNSCKKENLLDKSCKINTVTNSNINNITQDIRNIISKENITSETNIVIEGENTIYQIISSTQMDSNAETNMSIIDFGDCEKELLQENNLDYLLILKIDTKLDENTPSILNYEVYNPLTNQKLNLSNCKNIYTYSSYYPSDESFTKIKQLNEYGYDLFNINDDFYQDICSSFTSDNGTDILLSDRKNDFFENVPLCEDGCTYKGYDLNTKRICCECSVKEEIVIEESKNKNVIKDFFVGSNFSNLKLLKCFKLVFSKKGQKDNIGSIIFICINILIIILGFVYMINQEAYIIKNIRRIINENFKEKTHFYRRNINLSSSNTNSKTKEILYFPPKKKKSKFNNINDPLKSKNKNLKIFNYDSNNNYNYSQNILSSSNVKKVIPNKEENKRVSVFKKRVDKDNEINYNTYNFSNEELNSLSYDLAYLYDKRTYFQYYFSLLKQKHLIIFTFCNNKDYNIFILKLSLFLFSFALYFTINAIFFTDDTMHDIYENKGSNIISQISNIFYSTIISCFINIIIKRLGLSYNDMVKIKKIPNENNSLKESTVLLKKLKIKFSIFFLIIFLLVSFFWYFISAFCAVYKNTQMILIENTLSSFGLSLLYPFGINLIPGILRIPSLKNYSGCSSYTYFCSKLIALI